MRRRVGTVAVSIGIVGGLVLAACSNEPAAGRDPDPQDGNAHLRDEKKEVTDRRTETTPTETPRTTATAETPRATATAETPRTTATADVPRAKWAESGIGKCICDSVLAKCGPRCGKIYCSGAAADGSDQGACADCDPHASDACVP